MADIHRSAAHRTLDQLAANQSITPITDLTELVLDEPLTDDDYATFTATLRSLRGGPA